MYCTPEEVKRYLNVDPTQDSDDVLLNSLISAAQGRIEEVCLRPFEAPADDVHYFNPETSSSGASLYFDADISNITSIVVAGTTFPATDWVVSPRNATPWYRVVLDDTSAYYWDYSSTPEDSIVVTGRWACMHRRPFTAIARATNVVTLTMTNTTGIVPRQRIHVASVADTTFNGEFTVTAVTSTSLTYYQSGSNDTDTTGVVLIVPPTIRQACIRLTAWMYRQKDTQMGDADRPILAGEGSVIMPQTLPSDVQAILQNWIRIDA